MLSDLPGLVAALSSYSPASGPVSLRTSQVLDFVYWTRLLGALACGVVCGLLRLEGFVPLLALAAVFLVPYRVIVRRTDAPLEGVLWCNWMGTVSGFLVPWIVLYSVLRS